jgi:hypothetical protein
MNSWSEEVLPNIEMLYWQLVTQMASKCFAMKPKLQKKLFGDDPNTCSYISKVGHELALSINYVVETWLYNNFIYTN